MSRRDRDGDQAERQRPRDALPRNTQLHAWYTAQGLGTREAGLLEWRAF
jgi:hypothetical protein